MPEDTSKDSTINPKQVLDTIKQGVLAFDHNWNCRYANEEGAKYLGFSKKQILGKDILKLVPTFSETQLYAKSIESLTTNKFLKFQCRNTRGVIWYNFHINPSPTLVVIYINNVTEETEKFLKLEESEKHHRTLIESVKDYAIFLLDHKGKITTWNKGAENLLGHSAENIIGKQVSLFYAKEDRVRSKNPTFFTNQLGLLQTDGKIEHDRWWIRKDGSRFWANEITTAFVNDKGKIDGFTKVVRDMTERKNTDEMLKRYTQDLERTSRAVEAEVAKDEALLDSIGEAVVAVDGEGRIVVFNQQAQSLLGYTAPDVLGDYYFNVWNSVNEDQEMIALEKRPLSVTLKTGKKVINTSCYFSSTYRRAFPVMLTSAPVVLEGQIIGAVMVFRDIRKEKEVDRAKSEFVSLASHQLRTPLTAIKLYVEILLGSNFGVISTEQQEVLTSINESNEKMIRLVENLLNVSRLETGTLSIKTEQTVLKDFVADTVRESNAVAELNNCTVVLTMPSSSDIRITTDLVLLRQVLTNLINNAITYSKGRKSTVYVNVKVHPGKYFEISVEDSGIGIPKDALQNIFQRFYRADNAVKARTEGNGLGLYMCKMVTEALGGKIACVSKLEVGTTFTICFPLSKVRPASKSRRK